jgi:uncharacterized protein (TIGR02145 family)
MKRKLWFVQLMLLILIGLAFCTKPDSVLLEKLPVSPIVDLPAIDSAEGDLQGTTLPAIYPINFNPDLAYDSISDIDGNVYKTIQIGTQTWMAENLKTTRYNDGSGIPNVMDNSKWVTLKTGAYRWYNNDRDTYKNLYGALYNWYTVKTGKLCPTGWHVPGDGDWKQLEMALGMTIEEANSWGETFGIEGRGTDQGTQMKATSGWIPWEGRGGNGNNTSGFTALPAGESGWTGWSNGVESVVYTYFGGAGICTTWWYSTEEGGGRAVSCDDPGVIRGVYPAFCGLSVRCLKN